MLHSISLFEADIFNMWNPSLASLFFVFVFTPVLFLKNSPSILYEQKTSGCTMANHVILDHIYPNKFRSSIVPLWLPNGLRIIHLDPYNNTKSLGAIFEFPRFPCRTQRSAVDNSLPSLSCVCLYR